MRKYTNPDGKSCLACCICGLFDLPLHEIRAVSQEWDADPRGWFAAFYDWSVVELKHAPIVVEDDTLDDLYHLVVCEVSIRGETLANPHVVIQKGSELIFSPDPDGGLLIEGALYSIVFMDMTAKSQRHGSIAEFIDEPEQTTSE